MLGASRLTPSTLKFGGRGARVHFVCENRDGRFYGKHGGRIYVQILGTQRFCSSLCLRECQTCSGAAGNMYFTTLLPLSPTVNTRSTHGQHTVNTRSTHGQHEAKMLRKPMVFYTFAKVARFKILFYI